MPKMIESILNDTNLSLSQKRDKLAAVVGCSPTERVRLLGAEVTQYIIRDIVTAR